MLTDPWMRIVEVSYHETTSRDCHLASKGRVHATEDRCCRCGGIHVLVCRLWDDALRSGDIPGAYWALLTHPATTDELMKGAFGDVHMLSHLVGAANRADIRRRRALEAENADLTLKVEKQQVQLEVARRSSPSRARNAGVACIEVV
jgi:hypothetical protein